MIAFDVQGTNVLLENNIIFNGDDCLALSSPSDNIHFRNSYCNGGHGLSVCSLGYNGVAADVQNVMYVIHTSGKPLSLISLLKDRKCYRGRTVIVSVLLSDREFTYPVSQINSAYGARLKTGPADNGTARKYDESPSAFSTALIESN